MKLNWKRQLPKTVYLIVSTFLCFAVVQFAWIFFRANSVLEAKLVIEKILSGWDIQVFLLESSAMIGEFMPDYIWMKKVYVIILLIVIFWIVYIDYYKKYQNMDYLDIISGWGTIRRWFAYYSMIILVMFSFVMTTNEYGQAGAFLYFQF